MRNCLKRGIGYSICPEVSVRDEIAHGSLSRLPWEAEDLVTTVVMIWHAEKWCSPLLKHFMEIAREIFSNAWTE